MSSRNDPPTTPRDRACAVFARAALFPPKVDWSGKHHAIYPALQALDLIRKDLIDNHLPFSSLFPRRVMLVPSRTGGMQWNGQPDIDGSTVEVIPKLLNVKCMECEGASNAYIRTKSTSGQGSDVCREIVLCTNRLLKSDYTKSNDPTLLEQRRDLPPKSLAAVEEALAHQVAKLQRQRQQQKLVHEDVSCEQFAALELHAARVAECMFQKQGAEVRRGSSLKPPGFSLLPKSLQRNFQDRCIRSVATQTTGQTFGESEGKKCVEQVLSKQ